MHYTPYRNLGDGKPRSLLKRPWRKLRGFISKFIVLTVAQNGKLRVGKTRSSIKVLQKLIKMPQRKSRRFTSPSFRFGYSAKWKTRDRKPRKHFLRDFREPRVFDLITSPLLSRSKSLNYPVNIYKFVWRTYVYQWKMCPNGVVSHQIPIKPCNEIDIHLKVP